MNLKTVYSSDTKDFERGSKKVRQGIKDLEKVGTSTLSTIGDALGLNTGKIGQMTSAIVGLGAKLRDCGSTGGAAIGKLITGMGTLGAGIAGLGIGAAIAGFQRLNSLAENFGQTMQGISMKAAVDQYRATYGQAMMDSMGGKASGWFNAKTRLQTGLDRLTNFTGNILAGQGIGQAVEADRSATEAARQASQYAYRMSELQKQQIDNSVIIAQNNAKIAEYSRIIRDTNADNATRLEAEAKVKEVIQQNYELQWNVLNEMVQLQKRINDLSSNSLDDTKALADLEVQQVNLVTEREQRMASIERYARSAHDSTSGTVAELSKLNGYLEEASKYIEESIDVGMMRISTEPIEKVVSSMGKAEVQIPATIKPQIDKYAVQKAVADITPVVEGAFSMMGDSIGQLIGDLATGGDAWSNFGNLALSSMGDMAIAVGKIAIEAGLATEGIKKALTFGGGWVAIAAGTALVALGTAVKAGLSNVASGNYGAASASGNVASSSYTAGFSSSYDRGITVNVTGRLKANGSELVAVLNNESKRSAIAT